MSGKVEATLSEVAESWIKLNGKQFDLTNWPMHRAFYDCRSRRTLFKTGRQVGKSTTLASFAITECSVIPHFSVMFISPTKEQTVRFSNTRVAKTMRYSPHISRTFLRSGLADRVFHKQYRNGSEMLFTYALDDADRLRGPSTDRNMYDEVQDILYDPVIIVGNECLSHSKYAFETYAGTPKTMENTIQYLWENSSQTEWVMQCDGCKTYQYVDSVKSIGKEGIICLKCGKYLDPFIGQWVDFNDFKNSAVEAEFHIKGFHISSPLMPEYNPHSMAKHDYALYDEARIRWKRILTKFESFPESKFKNEVLGVSDDVGSRMISKEEVERLCVGKQLQQYPDTKQHTDISTIVAGVDWTGGGTTGVSRTALWIWGYRPRDKKLVCLFYKTYPGVNPVNNIEEIANVCLSYKVGLIVGDAGEGHAPNDLLRKRLGVHKVTQAQYTSQTKPVIWNQIDRYTVDKTTIVDNFFLLLKRQDVELGPLQQMKTAIDDMMNEYEDITATGRKVWTHAMSLPDDCLHAAIFGWLAFKIVTSDLQFYYTSEDEKAKAKATG
jgi:hypothetical protein